MLQYTSIVPAGSRSAYLVYQKHSLHDPLKNGGWGSNSESFMMKVVLDTPRAKYQRAGGAEGIRQKMDGHDW